MADDQEYLVRLCNPRDVSTDFATVVLKNVFEIEGIQAARVVAIARRHGSCQLAMGSRSNIEKRVNRVNDACRRNGCTLRFEICQRADPASGGRLLVVDGMVGGIVCSTTSAQDPVLVIRRRSSDVVGKHKTSRL